MNKEEKYNFDRFYLEGAGIFLDVLEDKKIGTIRTCKLLNEYYQQLAELKAENERLKTCRCCECQSENEFHLKALVSDLEQQLKEKDEEIEKLKKDIKEIIDFDYKHNSGIVYATRRSIEEIANLKKYIEDLQNDNKKLSNIICNKIKRNAIGVTKASDGTILNYTISKEYLDKFMKGA